MKYNIGTGLLLQLQVRAQAQQSFSGQLRIDVIIETKNKTLYLWLIGNIKLQMEQPLQNSQRKLSQPITTAAFKLPYLKQLKPMRYRQQCKEHPKGKDFDLHTNNCTLPLYDPSKDRNLAYFFHKESNRRIVEEIKEQERKSQVSRKRGATERVQPQPRRSYQTKRMQQVSKGEFQSYLNEMRARVVSEKE